MNLCKLLIGLLLCSTPAIAQDTASSGVHRVESINEEQLRAMQAVSGKCLLLKVWIPNCPTAEQQFKEFADFEQSAEYKIVFMGITNDPKKITRIADKQHYTGPLYMLDTTICPDIYKRFDIFCEHVSKVYKTGKKRFDTLLINANGKAVLKEEVLGFPAWLRKKC